MCSIHLTTDHNFIRESGFKSDAYIDTFLKGNEIMYDAHSKNSGDLISGKTKVGITICFLASGDVLYLAVIFNICSDNCTKIMYEVMLEWVINTYVGKINMT